jgi:hypothetical protein
MISIPKTIEVKVYWIVDDDGVIRFDFNQMEEEYYNKIDKLEEDLEGTIF